MTDADSLKAALEPCPFCGLALEKIVDAFAHPGSFLDGDCLLSGRVVGTESLALWNRRASTDAAPVAGEPVSAMGIKEAFNAWTEKRGVWPRVLREDAFEAGWISALQQSAHPPVPDAAGANIVLVSQDRSGSDGYQLHGLFYSFADAARHVAKDAGFNSDQEAGLVVEWSKPGDRHGCAERREWWVASRQPVRAALAQPPAAEPDKAIAIGRKLDAEDGGYPAPAAEPVGMREALAPETQANRVVGDIDNFLAKWGGFEAYASHVENGTTTGWSQLRSTIWLAVNNAALATGNGGEGRS